LSEEVSFFDFCPDWKEATLWTKWLEYSAKRFATGAQFIYVPTCLYNTLTSFLEDVQSPLQRGHSQRVRNHIEIELDTLGCPILPDITFRDIGNPYLTKDVQDMVREYCAAHLCEF